MKGHEHHKNKDMARSMLIRFIVSGIMSIPVVLYSDLAREILAIKLPDFPGRPWLLLILSGIIVFWGGWLFLRGAWQDLLRKKTGMNLLVSIALTSGFAYSVFAVITGKADYLEAVTTLTVVLLIGHYLEMRTSARTGKLLEDLAALLPDTAHKITENGQTVDVKAMELKRNDLVLVKAGEAFPADGKIIEGNTHVDESSLTGESLPVSKKTGDEVAAASVNMDAPVKVRVIHSGHETAMAGIIRLVQEIQSERTPAQRLADKLAQVLTVIALGVGTLTFIIWWSVMGSAITVGLGFAISVLIITCPHALGLAVPVVVAVVSGVAARMGILLKDPGIVEAVVRAKVVVFDKTGTLTEGRLSLSDMLVKDIERKQALVLASSLESFSTHPLGRALEMIEPDKVDIQNPQEIPGKGIKGTFNSTTVAVGNDMLMREMGIDTTEFEGWANSMSSVGKKVVYLARGGKCVAGLAFQDALKPGSKSTIAALKNMGYRVIILSGDRSETVQYTAEKLGVDGFKARVLPGEKAKVVMELAREYGPVIMVGDGVNDAPALTAANVGVAMGAGTKIAEEAGNVILVKDDPKDLVNLAKLSKIAVNKMRQNFMWATGYNIVAIPVAAGLLSGWGIVVRPEISALIMSASSIVVVLNALLLTRKSKKLLPDNSVAQA